MDAIEMARQLSREIQKNERYLDFQRAHKEGKESRELQKMITDFNLRRIITSRKGGKADRNEDEIQQFNEELREAYGSMMDHPAMMGFNLTKEDIGMMLQRTSTTIDTSADGEDPDPADYQTDGCNTGGCSGRFGCH